MEDRKNLIDKIGASLCERGLVFFGPITQSAALVANSKVLGGSYETWINFDRQTILLYPELWVCTMEGWKESVGVTDEIAWAKKHGKRIRYLDPKTLEFTDIPRD